jgi:Ca-activated chloride channel family protein
VVKDNIIEPTDDMSFASAVALFGMQLRKSKYKNGAKIKDVIKLAEKGKVRDENGYKAEFIRLVKSM